MIAGHWNLADFLIKQCARFVDLEKKLLAHV
jgi:hypothetical protein